MKKLLMILLTATLVACSSGVSVDELAGKMPASNRSVMLRIPDAGNPVSNGMILATLKVSGTTATKQLIGALAVDDLNIGVYGKSDSVNKATMIHAIEHADKIGKNTAIYFVGPESDKADLEKAANAKNIKLHYFISKK